MIYKDEKGRKLYPVCSWQANQHKIYNAVDRAVLRVIDTDYSEEAYDEQERCEKAQEAFDANVIDGVVYATWEDGKIIKDIIGAYDLRVI